MYVQLHCDKSKSKNLSVEIYGIGMIKALGIILPSSWHNAPTDLSNLFGQRNHLFSKKDKIVNDNKFLFIFFFYFQKKNNNSI